MKSIEVKNMKVINKQIYMIAIFEREGNIRLWKFKYQEGYKEITIKVDTIQYSYKVKKVATIHDYLNILESKGCITRVESSGGFIVITSKGEQLLESFWMKRIVLD